ncbi:MAG: hypothetical protein ABIO46_14400 [Chitinophagales bacterium]
MQIVPPITLEKIYDVYSPIMYGIALEVAGTEKEAEEILINTFQNVGLKSFPVYDHDIICSVLINLTLQTAHKHLKHEYKISQRQNGNSALLQQLLFKEINLENYCKENKLTFLEAGKKMRAEFNHFRKEYKESE